MIRTVAGAGQRRLAVCRADHRNAGRAVPSAREVPDRRQQPVGRLELGQVPGLGQEQEPGVRDGLGVGPAVLDRDDAVGLAPDHEHRDRHRRQAVQQPRVGHGPPGVGIQRAPVGGHRRLLRVRHVFQVQPEGVRAVVAEVGHLVHGQREEVGDGGVAEFQSGRVGEDHAADPRAAQQRDLRRDPAADGVPDDGHAGQGELVEHPDVQAGQRPDAVEALRAGRAPEPRVGGNEHPGRFPRGQQAGEIVHGLRSGPAVQQQERAPVAVLGHGDRHRADTVDRHIQGGGRHLGGSFVIADSHEGGYEVLSPNASSLS